MSENANRASDALLIARWVWPEYTWGMIWETDYICGTEERSANDEELCRFDISTWRGEVIQNCHTIYDVKDAERELIERGLAEQYGLELCKAIIRDPPSQLSAQDGIVDMPIATIATASLTARVSALASVIRSLQSQKKA